jgi:hypothetical protein
MVDVFHVWHRFRSGLAHLTGAEDVNGPRAHEFRHFAATVPNVCRSDHEIRSKGSGVAEVALAWQPLSLLRLLSIAV